MAEQKQKFEIFEDNAQKIQWELKKGYLNLLESEFRELLTLDKKLQALPASDIYKELKIIENGKRMYRVREEMDSKKHFLSIFEKKIFNDDEKIKANLTEANQYLTDVIGFAKAVSKVADKATSSPIDNWIANYEASGGFPDDFNKCFGYIMLKNCITKFLEIKKNEGHPYAFIPKKIEHLFA